MGENVIEFQAPEVVTVSVKGPPMMSPFILLWSFPVKIVEAVIFQVWVIFNSISLSKVT